MGLELYLDRITMMLYMGLGLMAGLYFFCANCEKKENFVNKQIDFIISVAVFTLVTTLILGVIDPAWETPCIGVCYAVLSVYMILHTKKSFRISATVIALGTVASAAAWCASSAVFDAIFYTLTPDLPRWGCYLAGLAFLVLFWWILWRKSLRFLYDTYAVKDWGFIATLYVIMGSIWPILRYVEERQIESGNLETYALLKLTEAIIDFSIIAIVVNTLHTLEKNAAYLANAQLLAQQEEQFRHFKDCVEYIDTKAHDLRHQIRTIRSGAAVQGEYLDSLEEAVSFYSAFQRTGNEVLDIVLTEKSILCKANAIQFVGLIEYSHLDFMEQADIFSLFGNAIDNAVEYLRAVAPENRYLNLQMRRVNDFLQIRFENFFKGDLRFEDDLPVTTKKDRAYHGFGVRSISGIAKKYQGSAEMFLVEDGFVVNLIFPLEN